MRQELNEKELQLPESKNNEGQIVIVAGSAGSGKNYTIKNFTNADQKFKTLDVDDIKDMVLKSDKLYADFKRYLENKNSDLVDYPDSIIRKYSNLEIVSNELHQFIVDKKLPQRKIDLFLKANKKRGNLPNLIVNTTFGDTDSVKRKIDRFIDNGYKEENIHVIWVFSTLSEIMDNNRLRPRSENFNFIKKNYVNVFNNIYMEIMGESMSGIFNDYVQGNIWILINIKDNIKYYDNQKTVKDFIYFTIRENGKWNSRDMFNFTKFIAQSNMELE